MHKSNYMKIVLPYILVLISFSIIHSQNVFLDKPILAGKLTCFPDVSNPNNYYYLTNKLRLGTHEDGTPQFSFLRYVSNVRSDDGAAAPREGEGGGVVHAVVELYDDPEDRKEAMRELKRLTRNDNAQLVGSIIYKSGTMTLISSIANKEGGFAKTILGLGPAPTLAGNKAAVSILLNKEGAKILWETFKTPTPDMSFSFVMNINGYRSPINAWIEINFDKVYESHSIDAGLKFRTAGGGGKKEGGSKPAPGGGGFMFNGEINLMFENLRQTGAIKVGGPQGDEKFEEIIKIGTSKLIDMVFEPVQQSQQQPGDMASMLKAANDMNGKKDSNSANQPGLQVDFAYKFKQVKKSGSFRMDLNRSMTEQLQIRFDENLGKIKCPPCFREVNLDDPMFRQREVLVSIDGMNSEQFKKYINFATVSMKKTHGNGDVTADEVRIGANEMDKTGNVYRLLYGWKDKLDAQKDKWLQYEYKTIWSFFGNYNVETPWVSNDDFAVNLGPPVRPINIDIEASQDMLKQQEVRSVNVKFYYNFGGGEKLEQINIKTDGANTANRVELVLPNNTYDYEYEAIWRLTGNREIKSGRIKSNNSLIYADELPK